MQSNIYEIYDIHTFELLHHGGVASFKIDFDSVAKQIASVTIQKSITDSYKYKGNLIIITDTKFSKNILGKITEIKGTTINFIDVSEIFKTGFLFENMYNIEIELMLQNKLIQFFNQNPDDLQNIPFFEFNTLTSTIGSVIWEGLPDGQNKWIQMNELIEKVTKEYRIYVTYRIDFDNKKVIFDIQRNQITDLYVDLDTPDVVESEIKIDLAITNKLYIFTTDVEGLMILHSTWYLLTNFTITEDSADVNRFDFINEGTLQFSNNQAFDAREEAAKFFKANAKANNEITFKIRKGSKIYDNQQDFKIGSELVVKQGDRQIDTIITGATFDTGTDYNAYLCGFNRTKLTKKLQMKNQTSQQSVTASSGIPGPVGPQGP